MISSISAIPYGNNPVRLLVGGIFVLSGIVWISASLNYFIGIIFMIFGSVEIFDYLHRRFSNYVIVDKNHIRIHGLPPRKVDINDINKVTSQGDRYVLHTGGRKFSIYLALVRDDYRNELVNFLEQWMKKEDDEDAMTY